MSNPAIVETIESGEAFNVVERAAPTFVAASGLVDRAALASAVTVAAAIVESRNTYPILANLRLSGSGDSLQITAHNLDIETVVTIPAPFDAHFDTTIPAKMLSKILAEAPAADMIGFTHAGGAEPVLADFERVTYRLNALEPASFPDMPFPGTVPLKDDKGVTVLNDSGDWVKVDAPTSTFTLPAQTLFEMLDSVQFAISKEETRYYLNGVYFHVVTPHDRNMPELRAVTTDGHRMARRMVPAPDAAIGMAGVIIPTATVKLLLKLLAPRGKGKNKAFPGEVTLSVAPAKIRFSLDNIVVTSKLIEGAFPDYERVTPRSNDKRMSFDIADMIERVKAVMVIAGGRGAVKLTISNDVLELSVNNPESGVSQSEMPVTANFAADGAFEIGFNAGYLLEILNELLPAGERAEMLFNDSGSPTVITGSLDAWLSVLMPMRV